MNFIKFVFNNEIFECVKTQLFMLIIVIIMIIIITSILVRKELKK